MIKPSPESIVVNLCLLSKRELSTEGHIVLSMLKTSTLSKIFPQIFSLKEKRYLKVIPFLKVVLSEKEVSFKNCVFKLISPL